MGVLLPFPQVQCQPGHRGNPRPTQGLGHPTRNTQALEPAHQGHISAPPQQSRELGVPEPQVLTCTRGKTLGAPAGCEECRAGHEERTRNLSHLLRALDPGDHRPGLCLRECTGLVEYKKQGHRATAAEHEEDTRPWAGHHSHRVSPNHGVPLLPSFQPCRQPLPHGPTLGCECGLRTVAQGGSLGSNLPGK